jgi:hypothetical protein
LVAINCSSGQIFHSKLRECATSQAQHVLRSL